MPDESVMLLIVTGPDEAHERPDFTPMTAAVPEETVYGCFFRTHEQRGDTLQRLREIAGRRLPPDASRDEITARLAERYVSGGPAESLAAAVEWWTQVRRQGYHAFNLKEGVPPYRAACMITFREIPVESIRRHYERAVTEAQRGRDRILDAFGFPR